MRPSKERRITYVRERSVLLSTSRAKDNCCCTIQNTGVYFASFLKFDVIELEAEGPSVSPRYWEVMNELSVHDSERAKVFYGGPLDFGRDGSESWLVPVEVTGREQYEQYHVIYVNCDPHQAPEAETAIISVDAEDAVIKASGDGGTVRQTLDSVIKDPKEPKIVIRHAKTGMLYYPHVTAPPISAGQQPPSSIDIVLDTLQIEPSQPRKHLTIKGLTEPLDVQIREGLTIVSRHIVAEGRIIYVHQAWLEDDVWGYYELYSAASLNEVAQDNFTPVRIDSGCDIGEIYDDNGCECREQFHLGVCDAIDEGGLIVHIPGHDGRGYGMVTKMETEGLKRGIPVVTNEENPVPMDTIQAAKNLLGDKFDIRTYTGAARIMRELGIFGARLFTDNKRKVADLEQEGLLVVREKTSTTGANGSHLHVQAKHAHGDIYYGHD